MIITSLEYLPGKTIQRHLGLVQGSSVRSKHAGRDIMASLKSIFGGELVDHLATPANIDLELKVFIFEFADAL